MDTTTELILGLHLGATSAMTGLIWFVQVVHYPLFSMVGAEQFTAYESEHTRRTAWIVGPFMGVEGLAALWIAFELGGIRPVVGLVLLTIVHGSTVVLQVPRHRQLTNSYDAQVARSLVTTNWIRTVAWTARSVLALAMTISVS